MIENFFFIYFNEYNFLLNQKEYKERRKETDLIDFTLKTSNNDHTIFPLFL